GPPGRDRTPCCRHPRLDGCIRRRPGRGWSVPTPADPTVPFLLDVGGDPGADARTVAERATEAEALGFDGIGASETRHDPFLSLALAAQATERIQLLTAIAVAFARSPMTVAQTAYDLQAISGGRF